MEKPLKRLSIFFIFIFFISILGVIYHHHEDGILLVSLERDVKA